MYKGKRDPQIDIVVRQSLCSKYQSKNDSAPFIEIFIPRSEGSKHKWGTIMVRPEQVYYLNDTYNLIRVNNYAKIVNSTKEKNTRIVLDQEIMTPHDIIGTLLKFELCTDDPAAVCFEKYQRSKMTMYHYMQTHKP